MRRSGAVVSVIALWMLTMGIVVPATPAEAEGTFQYLDGFDSGSYAGNDGSDDFEGPWMENNDWGGPTNGFVTVESGGDCPKDRCVRISGDPFSFWGTGIYRAADTGGAADLKASFRYAVDVEASTDGSVDVAVFDGSSWNTVHTIWLADHEDERGRAVHNTLITVTQHAHEEFMIGFFAHGEWHADFYIDRVQVWGDWDSAATTTTTTTTTQPPTTTQSPATTTTTTTNSPVTTTSTTVPPTPTTSTTTTTVVPGTTTSAPTTSVAALPPATIPPTTIAPVQSIPIEDDSRYMQKLALINANAGGEIMALPAPEEEIVAPGPVTQVMASLTTTAVTVRSHLLSAMALGLLIAVAAVWGLGKREPAA